MKIKGHYIHTHTHTHTHIMAAAFRAKMYKRGLDHIDFMSTGSDLINTRQTEMAEMA
uniref:Uncharacterized protein n=1 Tax=Octopus bimaculoides TaxID=37653 RepID=A0A0L8G1F6_OCTBM